MAKSLKVFGIGLNKTGTTTLGQALGRLGYRHMAFSARLTRAVAAGEFDLVDRAADLYESFADWPWPLVWRRMAERYGDRARFVLTLRESPEVWLGSLKRHAERVRAGGYIRRIAYGHAYPHGAEAAHVARYRAHAEAVRTHFAAGAAGRLLEVSWDRGAGWAELCPFLGEPVPDAPFPHANSVARSRPDPGVMADNRRRIEAMAGGSGKKEAER